MIGYLYEFLGMTVGCLQNDMDGEARKAASICDITHGTTSEFGFDYLRDNDTTSSADEQVQPDHFFVDENTGHAMPGRRWGNGLHQAMEAKEDLDIESETKTDTTITLKNYFRMYEKMADMTGTSETEAQEFNDIYGLNVVVIPTNKSCLRVDANDCIDKTRREKYNAVIADIKIAHGKGQPVLVGTTSVDASEVLSKLLKRDGIEHNVLNAKYHAQEADIIAQAGQKISVTIATNMAGRGTDIRLGNGVNELGGRFVLGTERHESRRIDRQLRGRCARQGDPGCTKSFRSLEDKKKKVDEYHCSTNPSKLPKKKI
jgi:preprotein translocase subunit SecA